MPLFGITSPAHTPTLGSLADDLEDKKQTRSEAHALYAMHFPIPLGSENTHDCNQRLVLLYGVGKQRQEELKLVADVENDLVRMFDVDGKNAHEYTNGNNQQKKSELLRYCNGKLYLLIRNYYVSFIFMNPPCRHFFLDFSKLRSCQGLKFGDF